MNTHLDAEQIDDIRAASRQIVRELGFMRPTLAATDYPPSAVHAILEIGARSSMASAQLADVLALEKSSVSRMVRKLIEAGELKEATSRADARIKLLSLTPKGRRTLAAIHAYGRRQVAEALARLPPAEHPVVGRGLAAYARALCSRRDGASAQCASPIEIRQGYLPGAIGRIVDMHARFYSRTAGFGAFFESLVATDLGEFTSRLEPEGNGLWTAWQAGQIVGSVAIDGEDLGGGLAHLRWFIVDDGLRGAGIGRRLLDEALAFCDRREFSATQLWTFRGLDAARRLYEACGFELTEERVGKQWGAEVVEQRFVRPRDAGR